jgi:hypothetical protein
LRMGAAGGAPVGPTALMEGLCVSSRELQGRRYTAAACFGGEARRLLR